MFFDKDNCARRFVHRWLRRTLLGCGAFVVVAIGVLGTAAVSAQGVDLPPANMQPNLPDGRRLRDLPPEERRQIMRERFQSLPPAEQERIRQIRREAREANAGRPLSPEQRQQLRRDIRDHGRDVYGTTPNPGSRSGPRQR